MSKPGKVTGILKNIRGMNYVDLLTRFMVLVQARAIREYLAAREDFDLTIELNLVEEELKTRLAKSRPYTVVKTK